jgi:serine protease Do
MMTGPNPRLLAALLALNLSLAWSGVARAQAWPGSFAPLVRLVAPEVVGIAVTEAPARRLSNSAGLPAISEAAGSGFIIAPDGMIVTNNHVISGAREILVTLDNGQRFRAKIVGADELTDIAIIKVSSPVPLPAAHWGDSAQAQVGDWVLAAGNPFDLGNSFTAGIISAEGRDIGDGPFDHFLQLDAPINPGNSGGPAFDLAGDVIGINTAIVSPSGGSVGIAFAIPSNSARVIVSEIIAHGGMTRGWLGVSVADIGGDAAGAEISGIEPNGPAARAGLGQGDIVLQVNGVTILGSAGLIRAIASVTPGTKVVLRIRRRGHIENIPVVVDQRPAQLGG